MFDLLKDVSKTVSIGLKSSQKGIRNTFKAAEGGTEILARAAWAMNQEARLEDTSKETEFQDWLNDKETKDAN